ncbi:MAG: hypothetical protein HY906_19920 [Deltaproteobacteria bacterium]|nr:hypothetical protein [Deltaproteobacteria bacterium]
MGNRGHTLRKGARRAGGTLLGALLTVAGCGGTGVPVGHDGGAAEAATMDGPVACLTRDAGCDPVRQTGCGDGEKCSLVGSDLQCVLLGAGTAGAECQAIVGGDSCAAGLICASAGGASTCVQFCDRVCGEPCGVGTRCNTRLGDTGEWGCGPLPPPCDLLAQDCAGAGEACYLVEPATNTTGCLPEGTLPEGAACTAQGECGRSLVCLASQAGGLSVCVPLCDTRLTVPCASGVCTALEDLDPVGYCH